jgi:hypothetical protein
MVATIGSIRALFEADMGAYVAGLQRGERATAAAEGRINRNLAGIEGRFVRLGGVASNFGKGLAGGIVGGLSAAGLAGIVKSAGDVAKRVASIGDEAKRAGLSVKAFQELRFVAEQNRIGVDQMVDGLKELQLRADEWITTGSGPAAEAFHRLGYDATTLRDKLRDPSALFSEIIGKLGQLDKAAQIRIADEVFGGTAGERFVELVDQGEAGIRRTIESARNLGIVLDQDVIKRAERINRLFGEISASISGWVQPTVIRFLEDVVGLLDRMKPIELRSSETLGENSTAIDAERLRLENEILDLKRQQGDLTGATADLERRYLDDAIAEKQRQLGELSERAARIERILSDRTGGGGAASAAPMVPFSPLPAVDMNRQMQLAIARDRIAAIESVGSGDYRALGPVTDTGDRAYGRYQIMGANIAPWSRQALGVTLTPDQLLNNPQFQDRVFDHIFGGYIERFGLEGAAQAWFGGEKSVGKTGRMDQLGTSVGEYGKRFAEGMREAKASVDALGDSWEGLREEDIKPATEAVAAQQQAYDQLGQVAQTALSGLKTALADGKLEGREVLQILISIVEQLLQMPAGAGGGGGGGLFGGLLSSILGFADGGEIRGPGGPTDDKILIAASDGEHITRAKQAKKYRGLLNAINGDSVSSYLRSQAISNGLDFADGGLVGNHGNAAALGTVMDRNLSAIPSTVGLVDRISSTTGKMKVRPQKPGVINVNVEGANGDPHVIALVKQGVGQGLSEYDRGLSGRISDVLERQG